MKLPCPKIALSYIPSISSTEKAEDGAEGLFYWERDLPFTRFLGNKLRRWQTLWNNK